MISDKTFLFLTSVRRFDSPTFEPRPNLRSSVCRQFASDRIRGAPCTESQGADGMTLADRPVVNLNFRMPLSPETIHQHMHRFLRESASDQAAETAINDSFSALFQTGCQRPCDSPCLVYTKGSLHMRRLNTGSRNAPACWKTNEPATYLHGHHRICPSSTLDLTDAMGTH